jgi:hypothetical protein
MAEVYSEGHRKAVQKWTAHILAILSDGVGERRESDIIRSGQIGRHRLSRRFPYFGRGIWATGTPRELPRMCQSNFDRLPDDGGTIYLNLNDASRKTANLRRTAA